MKIKIRNRLNLLPEELIYYIFEYHNPYKEYFENRIIQEMKMNNILIKSFYDKKYILSPSGFILKKNDYFNEQFDFDLVYQCMQLIDKHYIFSNSSEIITQNAIQSILYLQRNNREKFNYKINLGTFIMAMILKGHQPFLTFHNTKVDKDCLFKYFVKNYI